MCAGAWSRFCVFMANMSVWGCTPSCTWVVDPLRGRGDGCPWTPSGRTHEAVCCLVHRLTPLHEAGEETDGFQRLSYTKTPMAIPHDFQLPFVANLTTPPICHTLHCCAAQTGILRNCWALGYCCPSFVMTDPFVLQWGSQNRLAADGCWQQ